MDGNDGHRLRCLIGRGYYSSIMPSVIRRNILENPRWYTPYTPYQAEAAQGNLEMSYNFQEMTSSLTGLPIASSSMLDEGQVCAESMSLSHHYHKKKRPAFLVSSKLHPHLLRILKTRATGLNVSLEIQKPSEMTITDKYSGVLLDHSSDISWDGLRIIQQSRNHDVLVCINADPLALCLFSTPGELGADVAVGTTQRFGVPMGFGGPHAAFITVSERLTRLIPGKMVGKTVDRLGDSCYRLALQTREQHIRKDKSTSNICTSQTLVAHLATAYAIYHGPGGLTKIARNIEHHAETLRSRLRNSWNVVDGHFGAVRLIGPQSQQVYQRALKNGFLVAKTNHGLSLELDELTTGDEIDELLNILSGVAPQPVSRSETRPKLYREKSLLTHKTFNQYHDETSLQRYLDALSRKDYNLLTGCVPLGSCTMKLNAASQLIPLGWRSVSDVHPETPPELSEGYQRLLATLNDRFCQLTGFDRFTFQPNSGATGELTGLLMVRKMLGDQRNVCLVSESAHGTNLASAALAGFKVQVIKCDPRNGSLDLNHLQKVLERVGDRVGMMMITYPSTYGVFEPDIKKVIDSVHLAGGQVYLDGANFNALMGRIKPRELGFDLCHLNLHKTFCIPHGGGGPGVGPVGVAEHLMEYLPSDGFHKPKHSIGQISSQSSSILTITDMYLRMSGIEGLRRSSNKAIQNTKYLIDRLKPHYDIFFPDAERGHEFILDMRPFKKIGISEFDIAKRFLDYNCYAPTMSWPIRGTLMIEPTESEPKTELDRLCNILISIRKELRAIENGVIPQDDNPILNAPHPAHLLTDEWNHEYSREMAVYPLGKDQIKNKYWPMTTRVNDLYGDQTLVCSGACHGSGHD